MKININIMRIINLFRPIAFFIPVVAIVSLSISGCSSELESGNDSSGDSLSIKEINAERGDACDCISSTITKIDAFTVKINSGEYKKSSDLNAALVVAMQGCMSPTGIKEADAAWSKSMSGCESFVSIRDAMMLVSQKATLLKEAEQDELLKQTGGAGGATEILNRLSNKNK